MERSSAAPRNQRLSTRWFPMVLLAVFTSQCLWFIDTQSLTYDEPIHLYAGLDAWQHHAFGTSTDHPPLARLWSTLPLAFGPAEIAIQETASESIVKKTVPPPVALSWRTRPMIVLLGIALGFSVWWATRKLLSEGAAILALALFAFSPELIAHFSMATTDGAGTLFVFLGAWQLVRWHKNPDRLRTVQLGACFGGMVLSKFYGVPLVAVGLLIVLLSGPAPFTRVRQWRWKQASALIGIVFMICWAGYFFHVSRLEIANGQMTISHPNQPPIVKAVRWRGHLKLWVPAGELVDGVRSIAKEVHHGRPGWFLGKAYPKGGTHWYYPAAIELKWPIFVLPAFVLGAVAFVRRMAMLEKSGALLFVFPSVYAVLALTSSYNIGVRHVLPIYPFVLVVAGASWQWMQRWRADVWVILALVFLHAADVSRYAPGYLSYFNPFIRANQGWRDLSDSNIDWGQGLLDLRQYQGSRSGEMIHLAYFGTMDPALYGIIYEPLAPRQRVSGLVVVSMSYLSGQMLDDPESYRWLLTYKPAAVIDHCMYVYEIP